jgi:cytochrome P450
MRHDVASMPRSPMSARSFFRDPVGFAAAGGDDGGLLRFAAGTSPYALARDPEDVWRVLVTDGDLYAPGKWKRRARRFLGPTLNTLAGDDHRARRRLLAPSFTRSRVATFVPAASTRVDALCGAWRAGHTFDVRAQLDPLSLAIAADVLLSADLGDEARELAGALRTVMAGVPRLTPPIAGNAPQRALARVDETVARLVAERRAVPVPGDLLGRLIDADAGDDAIRGDVIACLLAAVDEPPSALEAAWWLLAHHDAARAALCGELDDRLQGRAPGSEDLPHLPVLRATLLEAMRLFPPARHIDRCPMHDVQIGAAKVRAGTNVIVSPLVTHHDDRLYASVEAFDPRRWIGTARGGVSRGGYLPFGAGVHTCIGESLAMMIMQVTLAGVAQRWHLRPLPGHGLEPPSGGPLRVTVVER